MKYVFPEGLYTDVRIEHLFSTEIAYTLKSLDECNVREYSAAFLRMYDGNRWYYESTSDLDMIQAEIDALAKLAAKNSGLAETRIYKNFSSEKNESRAFAGCEVSGVPLGEKISLLESLMPYVENDEFIKLWQLTYVDEYKVKEFYNSKGAEVSWDFQHAGFIVSFMMAEGEQQFSEWFQCGRDRFGALRGHEDELSALVRESRDFLLGSEAVEPGAYTVVLAPYVTGVFAHECFGHKSESDFMIGDEEAKKEWTLGKRVGPENLTIIDTGLAPGPGYVPFDDEGNAATKTFLIKDGILTGRLHSAASAADLGETVTGNARAMGYEFEPIVRMTSTYIEGGGQTKEELISQMKDGIYVKKITHGTGMSTFTLAPSLAYTIKDGKIDKPVRISVVSGNVFESLGNIDGIANDLEMISIGAAGGCGKMEQYPLPVGFGGPHIRVRNMQVQ